MNDATSKKQHDPASDKGTELNRDRVFGEFSWIVARTKGDPHCKISGCYGRGVIGLRRMEDTEGHVGWGTLYCSCAKKGQSEFALIEQELVHMTGAIIAQQRESQERIIRATFWGGIRWAMKKVLGWARQIRATLKRRQPVRSISQPSSAVLLEDGKTFKKVLH